MAVPVPPDGHLPLSGLTVLTTEDSRYASEAMRLLCQRLGARLRRADSIAATYRHLRAYRPDILIVDLGLPDGDGTALIADLAGNGRFTGLLLATSADPAGREAALAAGATGFLEKPIESLSAFQNAVQHWLKQSTEAADTGQPRMRLTPDRQALRDDLARAALMLAEEGAGNRPYIARFIKGLARSSHDTGLESAAARAVTADSACAPLARILAERLHQDGQVFAPESGGAKPMGQGRRDKSSPPRTSPVRSDKRSF